MNKLIPKRAKPSQQLGEWNHIGTAPQGMIGQETVESVLRSHKGLARPLAVAPVPMPSCEVLPPPLYVPKPLHKDHVKLNYKQRHRDPADCFASGTQAPRERESCVVYQRWMHAYTSFQ